MNSMRVLISLVIATAGAAPVRQLQEVEVVPAVDLGTAKDFAILSKTGISTVPASAITGNIGVSPISSEAITGFSLVMDGTDKSKAGQFTGFAYAPDYTSPTPSKMTTAVGDMETAYTNAAGRLVVDGAKLDSLGGIVAGKTFVPGVYGWGTDVYFSSDIYIEGNKDDVFIFKSTGNIIAGSGAKVILKAKGTGTLPLASNIFWQCAGYVDAGTTSHLEGIFLVKTMAAFKTGSSLNGRIFAQTAVSLDSTTITEPPCTETDDCPPI